MVKFEDLEDHFEFAPEQVKCAECGTHAEDLDEYDDFVESEGHASRTVAVIMEEGTFNFKTGSFWCTPCYIKIGMPLGVAP